MSHFSRIALLLLFPIALDAQGVVAGRVRVRADTGAARPAAGARVALDDPARTALTDADGNFVLPDVPLGARVVRVRIPGYRIAERGLRVRAGDTARVDVVLQPETQLLTAVRVLERTGDAERFAARPSVATTTMAAADIAGVPTLGEPDVVRVAQLMPGVVSRNDYNTGLVVRGGEADQNLILLDGHPLWNPFHLGGLFSTFMDATVGGFELRSGAFPARFGGRLSSVLDVRSAEDARPEVHGTADVSALAATARVAGGLGTRGSWSVAARRTYADAVTRAFSAEVFPYHFQDVHGRASWEPTSTLRVALTGYAGHDVLDADFAAVSSDTGISRANQGSWSFDWGNRLLGLAATQRLGDRTTLEQRASVSSFSALNDVGDGARAQRSEVRELRLSGEVRRRTASHEPSIGYEASWYSLRYASGSDQTGAMDFDLRQRPFAGALYASDLWTLSPRWLVEGGVRAEALSSRQWTALSPRLSVKFFATPELALTAGTGRVTQWLHSLAGDGALRYFDVWLASDEFTPVATAWQYVAGVERRTTRASLRVEGFVKRYDRVMEVNRSEDPFLRGDELLQATGLSYGADLLARWQGARGLSGWIAYSYGLSSRTRDGITWAPGHDRRHDLDAVATWRMSKYRLGARVGYASGTPYTPILGEIARRVYDPSRDTWGTGDPRIWVEAIGGARNAARYPATHRLDLDASREFTLRGATVAPYLSLVNAYNAQNVFVYLYDYSTDRPTRRAISQFPILPSVGVRVAF